ncbi:MAG TPA: glycosyltransferase family A protein [Tepidisphaeraceae bacterium]|nr:glycosyltransferase family A protein [Tepidisphaeraceae bacterium]
MPLVSVLMPMRNARPFVREAVRSVLSQAIGEVEVELLVLDDGSTDGSADVVRDVGGDRVRLLSGPAGGIAVALNRLLSDARGDYAARCDADDLYPPNRLARQVAFLQARPDFIAACGSFSMLTHDGRPVADMATGAVAEEITAELRAGRTRTHLGTFLIRSPALRAAGGFRPYFRSAEDLDLQLRLGEAGRVWYDPAPAYAYRLHDASVTHRQATTARRYFEHAAREFQRQRLTSGTDDLQRGTPPPAPDDAAGASSPAADHVQRLLVSASWREHRGGDKRRALATGWRAAAARPTRFGAWKNLVALALKPAPRRP